MLLLMVILKTRIFGTVSVVADTCSTGCKVDAPVYVGAIGENSDPVAVEYGADVVK